MGKWCSASSANCDGCSGAWCASGPPAQWSYECEEGPEYWGLLGAPDYPKCNGKLQSPINIPLTAGPEYEDRIKKTGVAASPFASTKSSAGISAADFTVTQSHGAPKFSCASAGACGTLTREAVSYDLVDLQFHSKNHCKLSLLQLFYLYSTCSGSCFINICVFDESDF